MPGIRAKIKAGFRLPTHPPAAGRQRALRSGGFHRAQMAEVQAAGMKAWGPGSGSWNHQLWRNQAEAGAPCTRGIVHRGRRGRRLPLPLSPTHVGNGKSGRHGNRGCSSSSSCRACRHVNDRYSSGPDKAVTPLAAEDEMNTLPLL
ncbi:unnamed protein product [Lota lota]